jgi:hypothetical protein
MLMIALFSALTSKSFFKAARTARTVVNCFFFIDSPQKILEKQKKIWKNKRKCKEAKKIWRRERRFGEAKEVLEKQNRFWRSKEGYLLLGV